MRQRLIPATLTFLLFVGCVSIDDRTLTEHDGQAGDAGDDQGGSGGSSGSRNGGTTSGGTDTGGSSGRGGSSGNGGSATGGTSGQGGTGQGGSGGLGTVEDCDGDPLPVDEEVVRACLLQIGCSPFVPLTSLSFCITNQRLRTFSQEDCGSGVTNCDEYLECRGEGYYADADCTSGAAVYCEAGSSLGVVCNRYPYAIDCGTYGGTCATYTDDAGSERVGCRFPELDGCTEPAGMQQCSSEGVSYNCWAGTAFGTDCELIGSVCRDGSCYYLLPNCTTPGATCGTPTRLDSCYDSAEVARYECAEGLACEETSTSAGCVAPGCSVTEPCTESCSGTELTFCYGGSPVTLDCTDYGFRTCLEQAPNAGDDPLAFCAFPESAVDRICEVEDTDTTCGACAKTECCSEWTACLDSSDCVGYLNCTSDCDGISECITACGTMYPLGRPRYDAFFDCREDACAC